MNYLKILRCVCLLIYLIMKRISMKQYPQNILNKFLITERSITSNDITSFYLITNDHNKVHSSLNNLINGRK